MDYEKLKEVIAKKIKENGRGEITGPILQAVLMAMVDSLGEVYPQTYTDEQKAQARANIDALSNYDGEITKEKLSAEVQAILDDVANKQNITDESLATIAKTIVGAINEVYKGGLEDASIATSKIEDGAVTTDKIADTAVTEDKLASQSVSSKKIKDATIGASKLEQAVRDTLRMVGTNVKELPAGTDLLSPNLEDGIWIVFCSKMTNAPSIFARYEIALLIVNSDRVVMMGTEASEEGYPVVARRGLKGNEWGTHTMISVAFNSFRSAVQEALYTKLDNTAGAVGVKNIADGAVIGAKIADNSITTEKLKDQAVEYAKLSASIRSTLDMVGMNVKVLPKGTNLLSADLEDGIWLVTDPNSYTNPPSWFSGNGVAILAVDKASNNVILIGHDGSSNELPAWASRYLSSTSGWRGAGKGLEEIFAKKNEIGIKKLPKNTDLYDDTAIENGILYTLYVDYYGNPHPFYTNFPEKMNNGRPALLFRVDDKVCIIGADSKKDFPFYAWRNVGELKMWAYTSIANQFNYTLQIGSYLDDTEINNIWDNN